MCAAQWTWRSNSSELFQSRSSGHGQAIPFCDSISGSWSLCVPERYGFIGVHCTVPNSKSGNVVRTIWPICHTNAMTVNALNLVPIPAMGIAKPDDRPRPGIFVRVWNQYAVPLSVLGTYVVDLLCGMSSVKTTHTLYQTEALDSRTTLTARVTYSAIMID